jgi:protein-tyrosine phosphatase
MEKLFGVVRKAANTARTIVSGDRYRFTEDGFDLDLVYVTPNIIAMGYPAEGPESAWRNNINDVARFFRTKHSGHFKIFNLSERTYDTAKLDNMVKNWAWADFYPPLLLTLWHLLEEMDHWLSQDPQNVIAVHCKNGRGRTGVAIAAYLLYKRVVTDPDEALKYFNRKRSVVGEGVTIPSQKRYVKYIEMISSHQIPISLVHAPKRVRLHKLILRPVPVADISGKGCRLWFEIYQSPTTMKNVEPLFATKPERKYLEEEAAMSLQCDLEVQGDICVKVFHKTQVTSKVSIGANLFLFRFSFHTSFVNDYFHDLTLKELEGEENSLSEDKSFHRSFTVRLIFGDL